MFSTPTVRTHNQENSDSVMRKPQHLSTRKALQDCGVNRSTHFKTPIGKKPSNLLVTVLTPKPKAGEAIEPPIWEMEMLREPPSNEMPKLEADTVLLEEKMQMPLTPPPSPLKEWNFDDDFEFMRLPPPNFQFEAFEEHQADTSIYFNDDSLSLEKPTPIDYSF